MIDDDGTDFEFPFSAYIIYLPFPAQVLLIAPPLVSSSFSALALLRRLNLHTQLNLILWCARSFWILMIQPPVPFVPPTVLFVLPLFQSRFFFFISATFCSWFAAPPWCDCGCWAVFKKFRLLVFFLLFHLLQLSLSAILLLLSIDYWWVILQSWDKIDCSYWRHSTIIFCAVLNYSYLTTC